MNKNKRLKKKALTKLSGILKGILNFKKDEEEFNRIIERHPVLMWRCLPIG